MLEVRRIVHFFTMSTYLLYDECNNVFEDIRVLKKLLKVVGNQNLWRLRYGMTNMTIL